MFIEGFAVLNTCNQGSVLFGMTVRNKHRATLM